MEYRNKNTNKIATIENTEVVGVPPYQVTVHILSDGTRWGVELFAKNWELVPAEPTTNHPFNGVGVGSNDEKFHS